MKKLILFIGCVVLVAQLVGCKSSASSLPPPSPLPPPSTNEVKTVEITKVIRDTVIKTEKDSSYYRAYIECINGKPVIKEPKATAGKNLKEPKVDLEGNQLKVDCQAEAQELFHQWQETYIKENKSKTIKVPYAVATPLSQFQVVQLWFGRLFIFLLLLFLIATILRYKKVI
jgi:hypothetical protein